MTGCSENDDTFYNKAAVRVDLAFTLSGPAANKTRMADDVVQISEARDYDILHIIPMIGNTPDIQSFSNETVVDKPSSTNPTAQFYHYGNCDMSAGVNKCIVYAKAQAVAPVNSKAHNGSLTFSNNDTPSETFPTISAETDMSKISFSPVSMLSSTTAENEALALAQYLTDIANAKTAGNVKWCESSDKVLKRLYKTFTNNGADIPGSAASVKTWVSQLKTVLNAQIFESNTVASDLQTVIVGLCDATTITIDETSYTLSKITYPRNKDLPDGAAVLRWNDTNKAFEPQTQTTTLDNVSTITRYAYPPELYYFVESNIRCKATQVAYQSLYSTNDTWADFIDEAFPEADTDGVVSGTTHSVALINPVQYAVAHLQVNVQAGAANLTDAAGTTIPVGTDKFPLTGVIVGGQRAVDYKFDPIIPAANSEDDIKFVYDSEVNSYSNNAYSHYLTSSTAETANTLVLQSKDQEDVTIILEFENKSGSQFSGVNNGVVYPNTRFYLVGTIPKPTYDEAEGDYTNRVFTKAYTTVVNLTVNSLVNAYNVLPNILTSDLEVGVEVMTKWIAAKPTTVVLN